MVYPKLLIVEGGIEDMADLRKVIYLKDLDAMLEYMSEKFGPSRNEVATGRYFRINDGDFDKATMVFMTLDDMYSYTIDRNVSFFTKDKKEML